MSNEYKDTYHVSNLGTYGGSVRPDMDGYVHLTPETVIAGNWDLAGEEMTDEHASDIAEHNVTATEDAERKVSDWREND